MSKKSRRKAKNQSATTVARRLRREVARLSRVLEVNRYYEVVVNLPGGKTLKFPRALLRDTTLWPDNRDNVLTFDAGYDAGGLT